MRSLLQILASPRLAGTTSGVALAFALTGGPAIAQTPTKEELWRIVQQQQSQIQEQQRQIETQNKKILKVLNAQTTTKPLGVTQDGPDEASDFSSELTQSGWWSRTSVGGYGELHYNGGEKDEVDFHRFVLFFGHEFNERVRLFSELEVEHALVKDTDDGSGPGEVELEQAFIEIDLLQGGCNQITAMADYNDSLPPGTDEPDCQDFGTHSIRSGLILIPVGILNEIHEPPTFYGVERNNVESDIIPSTWWEAGAALHGYLGQSGFSYDVMLHSGLATPVAGGNAFKIRNGRQKVAQATLTDPAITGRLKYTGFPGVEISASAQHQFDVTQNALAKPVDATLATVHVDAKRAITEAIELGFRGLYAHWWLDGGTAAVNPSLTGRDEQYGWYVEPSIKFLLDQDIGALGFFARYEEWDNNAGDSAGSKQRQTRVGFNYWPHPDVVLKFDYQFDDNDVANEDDRVNLGLGFQF